jgi:predicted glutamine amidotransferase
VAAALRAALRETRDLALEHGGEIKANVIIAGRGGLTAVRFAEPGDANSLYYLTGEKRWGGGTVIASEPLDDGPGWHRVEPSSLVQTGRHGLRVEPLDGVRARSLA